MGAVVGGGDGQLVATVVFDRFGVALDPDEADPVPVVDAQEAHPEIGVLLAGEALPGPAEDPPFGDGVDDILRVGVDHHLRALELERLEGDADPHELHAVVGREAETSGELLAVGAREEDDAVASGAGVSEGRTVGVDGDGWHLADGGFAVCRIRLRQAPAT